LPAEIVVIKGSHRGEFVQVGAGPITIGRSRTADLALDQDTKVSGVHARLTPLGADRWILEDLGSTNGTFVNDERVEQAPLRSGDLIKIGRSLIIFRANTSVHLTDLRLSGGGSSAVLRPSRPAGSSPALPPAPPAQAEPAPVSTEDGDPLQELVLAASERDTRASLSRALKALLAGASAGRAVVFLRHPITGGLGCAAVECRAGVASDAPVPAPLLSRALEGEVVVEGGGGAAPLTAHGFALGVVFVDALAGQAADAERVRVLTGAGLVLGLLVDADRSRRLCGSATEIVGLAQTPVNKRDVDVGALLTGTDRLYGAASAQRGLAWSVDVPPDLIAQADPVLLRRGLDRLLEHVLGIARDDVTLSAERRDGRIHVRIGRGLVEPPEQVPTLVDPDGVAADLRRASQALDDGALVVARVALLRAGARVTVGVEGERVAYGLDLEPAPARSAT